MTVTHPAPALPAVPAVEHLRTLVRADSLLCVVSGLLLLVAAGPLSDLADLDTTAPARLVGGFLLLLGLDLAWLSAAGDAALRRWVPVSAAGDVAWALASVAVAATVDLSGAGRALIAVQGLLVLVIGEAKLVLHRGARTAG